MTLTINNLSFVQTCISSPEQYDVYTSDKKLVGYIRLRWGGLTCSYPEYGGKVVYEADIGDNWTGCFENSNQRRYHLKKCAEAIREEMDDEVSDEEE